MPAPTRFQSTSLNYNNWKMFQVIAKCPLGEVRSLSVENQSLKDRVNLKEKDILSYKKITLFI